MSAPPDFWSRRRRAVAKDAARADDARQESEDTRMRAALESKDDAELLDLLGLPDPDSLTPADAAAFMARTIPARLRRRAMRALFHRFPELSVPDGLLDYDEDYTDAGLATRPERTVWTAVQRVARSLPEAREALNGLAPDAAPEAASSAPDEMPAAQGAAIAEADPQDDGPAPAPGRMVFRFEDSGR